MWKKVILGEVCQLINGRAYKKSELLEEGKYPVLRVGNFFSNRNWYYSDLELNEDKYCDSGDLLYAWSASFGPRIWKGGKVIYHYHIWKTDIDESKLDKMFLYYWFDWDTERIKSDHGAGTTMIHVTKRSMEAREILLPPLPEQQRIVAILDEAFAGIDAAIENTKRNLANARELFESYLNNVFTQKGDGWSEKRLREICDRITDGTHQTPKYYDNGFIFLSSKNVKEGVIDWDNIRYVDEVQHVNMQRRLAPRINDILLRKNGAGYGKAAIVDRDVIFDVYVSLAVLRPLEFILPRYLLHFINSPFAMQQFNSRIKGTGVPNLHLEEIQAVIVTFPDDIKEQQRIIDGLDAFNTESQLLEAVYQKKLGALVELKQSILQKAFSGELTREEVAA
ncbi:restriction endonuclease subunit S [Sneathiella sp. HT1-7]|uniref:restriction endonuclease subunit S n=1 Tax=Sneathiella sp. HT1-7 TaxID=2887192 RepID=UPI001D14F449|nr:restriction endonuclease subunit S [Sneathiella sp. HT1-7]MCC3303815.1 restriction endonuclease subunit S [Sneathiella sp. HT1-7]